ncbi:MAG: hypothetical protein PHI23_00580, partial [Candidatus Peribacteraceae bacterium]|nr:hypothetical protein [Candidatus Peribacteraceae bacterium]
MATVCTFCGSPFSLAGAAETDFYKRMDVPEPTECPACRRQRRLMFRNFFHLYHRTCDLTGKKILSIYDAGMSFPVYGIQVWWSDKWDGLSYGLSPDFS